MSLPVDSAARKRIPLFSGVMAYFPDALIEVAKISWAGNEKHNPGQPLHWARGKSDDHEDCIARHTVDALKSATLDEKVEHMAARAWRALAALQLAVEARDAAAKSPPPRAPVICIDCGADLTETYHSAGCLASPRWIGG